MSAFDPLRILATDASVAGMEARQPIESWTTVVGVGVVSAIAALVWDEALELGGTYIAVLLSLPLALAFWTGVTRSSVRAALQTFIVTAAVSCALMFALVYLLFKVLIPL